MSAKRSFEGGTLVVLVAPVDATLDRCNDALRPDGLKARLSDLPTPPEDGDVVAVGTPWTSSSAPSMDDYEAVGRRVLHLLSRAGIDASFMGQGFSGPRS